MTAISEEMASPRDGGEAGDAPRGWRFGSAGSAFVAGAGVLAPGVLLLGALVVYPIVYSDLRSFFDATGKKVVGLDNYTTIFTDHDRSPRSGTT